MIGNRFYTWFKNYYQWVGGAFSETLLLPLVRATAGLRAGAIRYDETTGTVETYDGTNWNAIPSASGFVPYTGATQDVNLGEQGLEAGYLQLDTTPTGTPADQGTIYWDIDAETAALIMNGTVQKVGEDVFFHVQNKTGQPIPKGSCVRFDGTDGNSGKILIAPFIANGTYPSQYFMGVTAETIANDAFGKVYHFGKIRGVNTQAYNAGDILYASTSVAGGFQTTPPVAPNNIIVVAAVISKANNGTLMVRSTLGSNLNTDEAVLISGVTTNQGLFYDNGLWRNKSIATVLGYTPLNPTRQLTINGTAFDLSADRSWSVGTVTSVGIVTGSAGTDINVSGSPVTSSGSITLNIPTASATNRGALSSTDWTTFNNKQAALNGTGFVKISGTTISYDNSTYYLASNPNAYIALTNLSAGTGISYDNTTGVITNAAPDQTVSITASGTTSVSGTYPNFTISSADQFNGTVTSVGLSSSTSGVTISDSPVTVSGTIGIAIATANGSQQGLLSSTDWTTFNNKQNALTLTTSGSSGAATLVGATLNIPQYQAAGNYITSLTGEATASGPGAASVTLSTTAVTGKLLTGLNLAGGGTIASTDSILQAFGKVQNQISAMVGGVMYQGTWNASTNTPTLTSSVGVKGYYYIVDVSGTTNLNGITDWRVGDWAIFNGSTWDKVDNTDAVSSVNGFTGAVSLTTSHIAEGTNLYYLDSRSRTAISLTTTGNSGAATYDNVSGIINVPQYTLSGLGGVPTTRSITINGTALDLSADRTYSVGTVTSVGLSTTTTGVTIGNTPVTGSGTITVNIATASGSQQGLLSSTDWTTFNNKQNALTNPVTGTGTSGQVAYFNGTSTITGESNLFWDAANDRLGIGKNNPGANLDVVGSGIFTSNVLARAFYAVGDNMTSGGFFALPQFNSANFGGATYTSLYALGTTTFGINFNQGASIRNAEFSATSISNNTTRQYVLPNASGTLALTSDISSAVSGSTGQVAYFNGTSTITGESNLFWDAANDRLGIGKNNPAVALDVVGAGTFSSSVTLKTTEAAEGLIILGRSDDFAVSRFKTAGGTTKATIYTNPSNLVFDVGSATSMVTFTSGGQVGIGTTSPAYFVEAYRNGLADLVANSGADNNSAIISAFNSGGASGNFAQLRAYGNTTGSTLFGLSTNKLVSLFSNGDSALAIGTISSTNLVLGTANTERLRITSGGNVGIGTTSPYSLLQVTSGTAMTTIGGDQASNATIEGGNVAIGANFTSQLAVLSNSSVAADSGGGIVFGSKYSGNAFAYYAAIKTGKDDATSGNFGGYLQFATRLNGGNVTERMRITSGGNVEINGGSIKTGAPSGGTARAWKLGDVGTQALTQSRYVEVEINGTTYWLLATDVQV